MSAGGGGRLPFGLKRLSKKLPGPRAALAYCGPHRTALVFPVHAAETARAQVLEAGVDLVQIGAHLRDLVVDRAALLRLPVEQREKARALAAHALGLQGDAVELGL